MPPIRRCVDCTYCLYTCGKTITFAPKPTPTYMKIGRRGVCKPHGCISKQTFRHSQTAVDEYKKTTLILDYMKRFIPFYLLLLLLATPLLLLTACSSDDNDDPHTICPAPTCLKPGDIVPESALKKYGEDAFFYVTPIPDSVFTFMQGRSFKADCTVPRDSLRYLICLHMDKNGMTIIGEMVLNKSVADTVLTIFHKLYDAHYPIERMRLIDNWYADDEMAMRDNNSSSFNFRFISHTQRVSKHGLGLAIDINTLYNPYHKFLDDGTEIIEPATGAPYLDRSKDFDYKIEKDDLCYRLFKEAGFSWGGDWEDRKDYQHFEI